MEHNEALKKVNIALGNAIYNKDKKGILAAYEAAEPICFDKVTSDHLIKEYERLVDAGNEMLGY